MLEEWARLDMRVQVHNSSDQAKPAPAEMSENGRVRRKRVPKLCDCCGPNTKSHVLGHGPVTKKRGRKKKEVANEVEVMTDNHLCSAFVDLESTPDTTDTMTVCEMQQIALPEAGPTLSGKQIIPLVLHNGTAVGPKNESSDADCTPLSDSIEPSYVTHNTIQASLDAHCDPTTPLDCMHHGPTSHSDCTEKFIGPAGESSITTSDQPSDTDAMEIEHAVYAVYLNTKALRDHRYCKRFHVDAEQEQANISRPPSAEIQQEDVVELLHGMPLFICSLLAVTLCQFLLTSQCFSPEYLELFYGKYGSFIPLSEEDILEYLNKHLNADLNDRQVHVLYTRCNVFKCCCFFVFFTILYTSSYRRKMINKEVLKYKAGLACASMHFFKVTYNKHILALEDLSTLEDQNWVNDQVGHFYTFMHKKRT